MSEDTIFFGGDGVFGFGKKDAAKIADKILDSSDKLADIYDMVDALCEKEYGRTYLACVACFTQNGRPWISGAGYVGISERVVEGLMYHGDILIYAYPLKLKSGDVVQVAFIEMMERYHLSTGEFCLSVREGLSRSRKSFQVADTVLTKATSLENSSKSYHWAVPSGKKSYTRLLTRLS